MTTVVVTYEWEIILRNERMGFGKKFQPIAATIDNAIGIAFEELAGIRSRTHPDRAAYDANEFVCVSAARRTEVRRTFEQEGSDE